MATNFASRAKRANLIPPDMRYCQAEIKKPQEPFRLGSPPPQWTRCCKKASWMAMEPKNNGKRERGAMTLCRGCRKTFLERFAVDDTPETAKVVPLAPFIAAHKLGGDDAVWEMVGGHP